MLKHCLVLCCWVAYSLTHAQTVVPSYYTTDDKFNLALREIIRTCGLDSAFDVGEDGTEKVSFAVIDLNGKSPVLGGVNYDNFIYPASVYKMYVAMEILKQASLGQFSLLACR